ncbi:MAG: hypothetical protein ACTHJM_03900, partial [Marmoricola sp.]
MQDNGDVKPPRRTLLWISLGLVLVLVIGAGVTAGLVLSKSDRPTYPKAWDPRIAPLAAIAAKDRGLTFKHPVFVEFLDNKAFDKEVTTNDDDLSQSDKKSELRYEAGLRALGLISGNVDLLKQSNKLNSAGILAFYAPKDKKIRIRGTKLTAATKVTLVHELTHVLQDQYFDIGKTESKLDSSATEDSWAYHALVEGDARRIEHTYRNSLPRAVRAQLDKSDAAEGKTADKELQGIPPFLVADQEAPYVLGETAITRAADGGGNAGIDALFRTPPVHEIQLMQPWLLGATWRSKPFTKPELGKGDKAFARGEFGAYYLYLILAERLSLTDALSTADGWGGDSSVNYEHGDRVCVKVAFTGIDSTATRRIQTGLEKWAEGMPKSATVTTSGVTVTMNACDPGKKFRATNHSITAVQLLAGRNQTEADGEKQGAPQDFAICLTNRIIGRFGMAALSSAEPSAAEQREIRRMA